MDFRNRITSNPAVMLGKPVVKDTRLTVELILRKLSEGATISDLIEMYPRLTPDDVFAVLEYAAEVASNEEMIEVF